MGRRKKPGAGDRPDVARLLREKGVEPVAELVDLLPTAVELDEQEAQHPYVAGLVAGDFELVHNLAGPPDKPWLLRLRSKLRLDGLTRLMEFCHPKLRTSQTNIEHDSRIVILITHFGDSAPAVDLSNTARALPETAHCLEGETVNES